MRKFARLRLEQVYFVKVMKSKLMHEVKRVVKMSGIFEDFMPEKITQSIWLAAQKVGGKDRKKSESLGTAVSTILYEKYPNGELIKTAEIGEIVERMLIENGHASTAK